MSAALDSDFIALRPSDLPHDEKFSFSCGRQQGFEFSEFDLPPNYSCD